MVMRLNEIETRKRNLAPRSQTSDADYFIPRIRQNCSTIIDLYKKHGGAHFFLRGIKNEDRDREVIKKRIRTDRRSTYSQQDTMLIQQAYEQLGIQAHRQNSIFVTSNANIASHWGDVFFIFPTDPFVFSYFKDNHEEYPLFTLTDTIFYDRRRQFKKHPPEADRRVIKDEEIIEALKKVIVSDGITTTNLEYPLLTQQEVLIHGTHYYAVRNRDLALRIINED
jgi:hypothetical protein